MKYRANPVIVDAFIIIDSGTINSNGTMNIATQDGKNRIATKGMMSRTIPQDGDYWVIQSDGYEYLNPKAVFERKYSVIE